MNRATGNRLSAVWLLFLPLTIWAAHFLLAYVTAAVYCAKSSDVDQAILAIRWIVVAITIIALGVIGLAVWVGRRRYGQKPREPGDASASPDQARFVWTVLQLMSSLSVLAILCVASVAFFFGDCR